MRRLPYSSLPRAGGFTLIELLVVIAIIGILASIILASLATARSKGNDAAIEGDMHSILSQAEIDYDSHTPTCYDGITTGTCSGLPLSSYGTTGCGPNALCVDPTISNALTAAVKDSANTTGGDAAMYQGGTATSYMFAVQMSSDPARAWCIDSNGDSKLEGTAGGTALTATTIYGSTIVNTATGMCK